MNEEFKKMNQKYNDDTYPEFPYISKNRITLLKKGLYRKHNAKYRGVTAVYDKDTEEFRFPLYGMYYIPEDLIIVPEDLELNETKKAFLNAALKAGYKQVDQPPKFNTVYFPEDSPEAKLALANKADYYYNSKSKKKEETHDSPSNSEQ
jgi:hypothetical protein